MYIKLNRSEKRVSTIFSNVTRIKGYLPRPLWEYSVVKNPTTKDVFETIRLCISN